MHKLVLAAALTALTLSAPAAARLSGLPFSHVDFRMAMSGPRGAGGVTIEEDELAFRIEAWTVFGDTAYRFRVERVAITRARQSQRQWCFVVDSSRTPGAFGMTVVNWRYETVEVPRSLVGGRVPTRWVLVGSEGRIASSAGTRPSECTRALPRSV